MKRTRLAGAAVLAVAAALAVSPVAAGASTGYAHSSNVVFIGGSTVGTNSSMDANYMGYTYGGLLPVDPALVPGYTFSGLDPSAVTTSALAPFDTAVLNMASNAMECNSSNLSTQAQTDLVNWVKTGKKLIIYDSECSPGPNYSWLPFPFTTNNPGAMGGTGTLTIVEENTLSSSDPASPYFVDAAYLGSHTDTVGDMNVMTTFSPDWYIDMSGTNYNNQTGPVHTYARLGSAGSMGLVIYNGLDQDYQELGDTHLLKIWQLELAQPWNPDGLAGSVAVVGISLTPAAVTVAPGGTATLTATISNQLGQGTSGVDVTFTVLSGPNAGKTGSGTTDSAGKATFSYTGTATGTDAVQASYTPEESSTPVTSAPAQVTWGGTTPQPAPPAVFVASVPGAPVIQSAVANGTDAAVTWTAPADNGSLIRSYTVTATPSVGAPVVTTVTGTPPDPKATLHGLVDGLTYQVTVFATNQVGNGPPSAPVSVSIALMRGSISAACGNLLTTPFTDMGGNVHAQAAACLHEYGIANGVTASHYVGSVGLTREQAASFVARMLVKAGLPWDTHQMPFTDVASGDVHAANIAWLASLGVVKGVTATQFAPLATMSRAEMASILVRAYELATTTPVATMATPFVDITGNIHAVDITKAATLGITTGVTTTGFQPGAVVHRDEMASFVMRTVNLLVIAGKVTPVQ